MGCFHQSEAALQMCQGVSDFTRLVPQAAVMLAFGDLN